MPLNFPSYPELHAMLFHPERIPEIVIALILALVIGMITGPRAGNAWPMLWIWTDILFGRLGDKLDKKTRPAADLMFRGFLLMAFAVLLAAGLAYICEYIAAAKPLYGLMKPLLIALAFSGGSVWFVLLRLYFALEQKAPALSKGAYYGIARTSRINLNTTDDFGITRVGMALSVRTLDKGVVAPALWYLIGGFPALFVYAVIGALAWRFGKDGFSTGFGAVPVALDKLLGFIPSLFTTVLISMASVITPTANITKSIRSWWGKAAPYAQGGHPLTALAWALEVTLGGAAKDIAGSTIKSDWTGPPNATAKVDHKHLRRAIYIHVMACLLLILALMSAYLWAGLLL